MSLVLSGDSPSVSGTYQGGVITSGTVNAGGTNPFPSSGGPTSVDFTSIPSWVKRITVMFNGVSTSGTSIWQLQVGSGSIQTTGYLSTSLGGTTGNTLSGSQGATTGFGLVNGITAANSYCGSIVLTLVSGNIWVESGIITSIGATANGYMSAGNVTLSGALDRVRITTVSPGTDTFDAGSINILYE